MAIMNRRNAMIGWAVWSVAKRVLKKKAKGAVPSVDLETARPNTAMVVSALALAGGAVGLYFWLRGGDGEPE